MKKLFIIATSLLVLTACHKQQAVEPEKGLIQVGSKAMDFSENPGVGSDVIDTLRAEAEQTADEAVSAPPPNSITQSDLDSARAILQRAGTRAHSIGDSKVKNIPSETNKKDSI